MEEVLVRESLSKLDIHRSVGHNEMPPWVWRELADVIERPLSIIFGWSRWLGEVEESKCCSCTQDGQEEVSRELQASQPHLNSWEDDGATDPENHFQAHEWQGGYQE